VIVPIVVVCAAAGITTQRSSEAAIVKTETINRSRTRLMIKHLFEVLPRPQACRKVHELNLVRPDKVPLTPADQLVGSWQSFLQEQCEYQQARNWQQ